eukprot:scaffold56081_cov27-Tisochrysis_lutea.AAC.8
MLGNGGGECRSAWSASGDIGRWRLCSAPSPSVDVLLRQQGRFSPSTLGPCGALLPGLRNLGSSAPIGRLERGCERTAPLPPLPALAGFAVLACEGETGSAPTSARTTTEEPPSPMVSPRS